MTRCYRRQAQPAIGGWIPSDKWFAAPNRDHQSAPRQRHAQSLFIPSQMGRTIKVRSPEGHVVCRSHSLPSILTVLNMFICSAEQPQDGHFKIFFFSLRHLSYFTAPRAAAQ
jgi:hypothetical protein